MHTQKRFGVDIPAPLYEVNVTMHTCQESVPQCSLRGGALQMDYEARPLPQSLKKKAVPHIFIRRSDDPMLIKGQ